MKHLIRCTFLFALMALALSAGPLSAAEVPLEEGEAVDVYRQDVPKLKTLDCAKCHLDIFITIRDQGGLHQLECRDCHSRFHTFKPDTPWAERVPQCVTCHDLIHGESFDQCLSCHQNAHAPLRSLISAEKLADDCARCHTAVAEVVSANPSAHAEVVCSECHYERHGSIPNCSECHDEPHTRYSDNASCTGCHNPHTPLQISYGDEVTNTLCQGCHSDPVKLMAASDKKHGTLKCVLCHADSHGNVPACADCHGESGPHKAEHIEGFSGCLECHGDPHSLRLE